jgi:uncharacterized membrane protein YeiH
MTTVPSIPDISPHILLGIAVVGTFVFGVSGGLAAVRAKFDLFGVFVLALAVGLSGGVIRDVLLNHLPSGFYDWRTDTAALAAGFMAYLFKEPLTKWQPSIEVFDAVGLSLFCVIGADVALQAGAPPMPAAILGMLTGIGGGVVRDILLSRPPLVLREGLYAVPALLGSTVIVIGYQHHNLHLWVFILGAVLCFLVRVFGMVRHINLPVATGERGEHQHEAP